MAATVTVGSSWTADLASSAADLRRAQGAAFAGANGSPLAARGGVVRHADTSLAVTINSADIITIQPGSAVIPGSAVASSGSWIASLPDATTIALDPRHVTNPRVDLIVMRQLDSAVVPTHGAKRAQIEVLTGTPDPAPSAPSAPSMAVELARITVYPSGGAAASVDSSFRTYAAALGGVLYVSTFNRLPVSAAKWQKAQAIDTGAEYVFNGTSWTTAAAGVKQASGTVVLSDGGAEPTSKTVSLPPGLFSSPPAVMLQPETAASATTGHNYWVTTRTSSSFIAVMRKATTTVTTYTWLAIGN